MLCKMDTMDDEINQLKKKCDELLVERDTAIQDKDQLKLQFLNYMNQWELLFKDRNDIHRALKVYKFKYDELIKTLNTVNEEKEKDFNDLKEAHDSAVKEYRLVMSERDEVHHEIEKLSENLFYANNKNESLEKEIKLYRDEVKTLLLHVEFLKNKIALLLHNDDKNLESHNNYQEKLEEIPAENECQFKSHLNSEASIVNSELQDKHTEILNIDLGLLDLNEDLGINLLGGRDDPFYSDNDGIYISSVNEGSLAASKLRVNDCILRVNNLDCSSVNKQLVLDTLRSSSNAVLVIRRKKPAYPSTSHFVSQLQVNNQDHGISLEIGVYINKITPGSLAAKAGNLDAGDRVLSINNTPVDNIKNLEEAMSLLNQPGDVLTIKAIKSTYCVDNCRSRPNFNIYKKYINNTTQTDKSSFLSYKSYQKPQYVQSREAMLDVPMKPHRNPLPINNSISELDQKDAITEIDSVNDAFRSNLIHTTTKHSKKSKKLDLTGDTWPKVRSSPLIKHKTGIGLLSHKNKERRPLSLLLNSTSWLLQHNSKTDNTPIDFSVRSGEVNKDEMEYRATHNAGGFNNSDIESNARASPAARPTYVHNLPIPQHTRYSQSSTSYCRKSMLYSYFKNGVSQASQFYYSKSQSVDTHYNRHMTESLHSKRITMNSGGKNMPACDVVNTFRTKKENPRFKIPSIQSVSNKIRASVGGILAGNIDTFTSSVRESQLIYEIEFLNPEKTNMPTDEQQSLPQYGWASKCLKKPCNEKNCPLPGELRRIIIHKSFEPLGIMISSIDTYGVFIGAVNKDTLASTVGLQVGDQLLEICGVNLRTATYKLAINVLQCSGDSITILVQYNPEKYLAQESVGTSIGSPLEPLTPFNLPIQNIKSTGASINTYIMASPCRKINQDIDSKSFRANDQRYLSTETRHCEHLGISIISKNVFGIFVHSVIFKSEAYKAGLRSGDRILEYNEMDFSKATLEEAIFELDKSVEVVNILAEYLVDARKKTKTVKIIFNDTQSIP